MAWTPITAAGALPRNIIKGSASGLDGVAALVRNPALVYTNSLRILADVNPLNGDNVSSLDGVITLLTPSVFRTSGDWIGRVVYRSWLLNGRVIWTIRDTSGSVIDTQTQSDTGATPAEESDVAGTSLVPDTLYTVEATFESFGANGTVYQLQLAERS